MSYSGQQWRNKDLPADLDFSNTALVLVTGTTPNTCGHILLYIGGISGGHYFHFNGPSLFAYPLYMNSSEYQRFLLSEGKRELIRRRAAIPHPEKAAAQLHKLLNGKWFSLLVSHNCGTFAAEVLHAGGNFYDMPSHCPVLDMASFAFLERVFGPIRKILGTQETYEARHVH